MNFKKIILSGLVAGLASFVIGSLLYMNPLTAQIYSASTASYCSKSMELYGGTLPWLGLMLLGGLVSTILLTILYSYTEKGLDGYTWKKGLFFGFLLWLVSSLPNAYNNWLLHSYPDSIIIIETLNSLVGGLVAGITMAICYEKIK